MRIQRLVCFAILMSLVLGAYGCTALGVKPWQHEILARPEMALNARADRCQRDGLGGRVVVDPPWGFWSLKKQWDTALA
jgi:hypothetical protein